MREFSENERSTSSDRRKGGQLIWTSFWTAVPKSPLFLKRFGDIRLPFSSENRPNRRNLAFSLEIITFSKPEVTQSMQSRWEILGRLLEPLGIRSGDGQGDRHSDRRKGGPLIWTSFWTDGAQKPVIFKAFRRHKAPILEGERT